MKTMIKRICALAIAGIVIMFGAGCISQQAQQIELDLAAVEDSLRARDEREAELREDIAALADRLEQHGDLVAQLRADHEADVTEIRTEIATVHTNLANGQDRMGGLAIRVDALEQQLGDRVLTAVGDTTVHAAAGDMKQMYDRAYLDVTRGNYDLAITGFVEYLKNYPETELADNAQYWIGECHYIQGDYESAITEFEKVLDRYPDGNKASGALLKIGYAYLQQGEERAATRLLKTVMERYPGSPEAGHARAKLLSLSE